MSLATQIIDQRVNGIANQKKEVFSTELGVSTDSEKRKTAAFTFLVAQSVLGLEDSSVIDGIVDGGNDFGVDAIYYEEPSDAEIHITILQAKYKNSLHGNSNFPENDIKKMIEAIKSLFDPNVKLSLNKRLQQHIEEIRSFVAEGAIPRVYAIAANNGMIWNSISQGHIDRAKEFFGEQVEWRHVGPEELLLLLQAQSRIETSLQLTGQSIVEQFDFRRVLVGRVSVSELARLFDQFGDRLLEKNIRRYLGLSGNRVNEAVAETLASEKQRGNFYFYNNGITIVCSQFRHNALAHTNSTVQVIGLQIVNGGQTSKTVHQVSREVGPDISSAQVLVRIYELPSTDEELVASITYATNSQNPVDLRDLKANDELQRRLAVSIGELGFTYRLKREDRAVSSDEFTSAVVAEAVLAVWRCRPHQARFSGSKHFGALYNIIFTKELNGAQAVIAALIMRLTENKRKRPPADAPDFLVYGSRFYAMMLGRYLLKDLGIALKELDHRNFQKARELFEEKSTDYFAQAEQDIESALKPIFQNRDRTLQRLSATFRRGDLVERLTDNEVSALRDP
jgi:hypothetical protein